MSNKIYIKKFNIKYNTELDIAVKYFTVVSTLYSLPITQKEILFLSYLTVKGGVFNTVIRNSFIQEHGISSAAIYNIISKLKKYKVLMKTDKQISVHPNLKPDFSLTNSIALDIRIGVKEPILSEEHITEA